MRSSGRPKKSPATPNYEGLTVDEIPKRLDDLSVNNLKKIRDYEKHNKNRETLIEQLDRRIRTGS
jgi:hypothetical protein